MFRLFLFLSTLLFFSSSTYPASASGTPRFLDVSNNAGLVRRLGPRTKYGGPIVADFNADGYLDIVVGHHDQQTADLYFNNGGSKHGAKTLFTRANWTFWRDTHAFTPFHATAGTPGMQFFASTGGAKGTKRAIHEQFMVAKNGRKVMTGVSAAFARGRGRTVVPISLRPVAGAGTDLLFMNGKPSGKFKGMQQHFAGTMTNAKRAEGRTLRGFSKDDNSFATAVDINGDGTMELVTFHDLRVYKVDGPYRLKDISASVLPKGPGSKPFDFRATVSVVEFDYDNDGLMDLYIVTSTQYYLFWIERLIGKNPRDFLLRNVGGKYVDVTEKAGIPLKGDSRGVTVGDFNNDGWIDMLVTLYQGPDRLYMNNGDGTFRLTRPNYPKGWKTRGDQPVAVDFDRDGRLDVALAEGSHNDRKHGGYLRIIKNVTPTLPNDRNWLLVRVGASPKGGTTSLHALVTVQAVGAKFSMRRRVGSPGTATGPSYIELLHFGMGKANSATEVRVKWADKTELVRKNVKAKQVLDVGKFY